MKRKFLEDLGLEKEVIDKIMTEHGTDVDSAKADYDTLKQQFDAQAQQITDRDKQLEALKKSSGDNEALTRQNATLQADNRAAKEKYEADMKELKLTTAIKIAIGGSAHDADLVSGLVDKSKLILSDDGKVTGLDEQVKTLKESKAFLFKESASGPAGKGNSKPGYNPKAGEAAETSWAKTVAGDLNKESGKNPYADAWETK